MKRFRLQFVTALVTFGIGLSVSWMFGNKTITTHTETKTTIVRLDHPCTHDKLVVKQQPDATARLRVLEAECHKFVSRVVLAIENVGVKPIRGYEVGTIQQYEYKKHVESSQAVMSDLSITLAVGETRTLNFGGGFSNGTSCGKPTGSLQKSVFWIKRIEYTDGTRSEFSHESP